jgi:hypothetical protein
MKNITRKQQLLHQLSLNHLYQSVCCCKTYTPKEKTGETDQIFLVDLFLLNRPKTGGELVISTIK